MSSTSNVYSGFGAVSLSNKPIYQQDEPERQRSIAEPASRPVIGGSRRQSGHSSVLPVLGLPRMTQGAAQQARRNHSDAVVGSVQSRHQFPTSQEKLQKAGPKSK